MQQKIKLVKGPKTETTVKQKKIDNENNEESFNENYNKTDINFRKNEIENEDDYNRKILSDSLEQSFNKSKENENKDIDMYQKENQAANVLKFKNSDGKEGSDEDNKEKEDKNEMANKDIVEQEKINPLVEPKKIFNIGINQNKLPFKEQNKKGKKAYSNFIQNIKKANKNKKNKMNMFQPDQKSKFVKVVNKIKVLKNISQDREREREREKEKEVPTQNENQLEDPLIEHVRNELLKENDEEQRQNQKENDLNRNENLEEQENNNIAKKEGMKGGYTGFVLLKQSQGAHIFQFKFEGSLEEMNKIFKTHKIEFEGGPVELIYTKDLANLRKKAGEKDEKEEKEEKEENDILKETKEQEPFPTMRKISIEEKAAKKEADDNLKIVEMKERIRIYKEELKKGDDVGIGLERRQRLSQHRKNNNILEKKVEESNIKNNTINNNNANTNANINQKVGDEINKNKGITSKVENKKITEAPPEKKQYTKIEVEQKKEKDRDKSYSRAMDRFKKRYKKDNSAEVRPKKSEKINEMAKQLENVLGKGNASAEMNYESKISKDIKH